jgi:hypothetical protein
LKTAKAVMQAQAVSIEPRVNASWFVGVVLLNEKRLRWSVNYRAQQSF